jgi:hypothetical protein
MSENSREQGAAFLASYDDLVTRNEMLEIENKAVHDQFDAVMAENDRLRGELHRVTGAHKLLTDENSNLKRILANAGSVISVGLNAVRPVRELRGSPQRDNDAMPKVVQMGPKTA